MIDKKEFASKKQFTQFAKTIQTMVRISKLKLSGRRRLTTGYRNSPFVAAGKNRQNR